MSELWLDTELSDERLRAIASVVRDSGLSEDELEAVFSYELAPFLGPNLLQAAGEWSGFDPDWVCAQARARVGQRSLLVRFVAALGLTTYAARPSWETVKTLAFSEKL